MAEQHDDGVTAADLAGLVGHRFPGGTYRIAHWENWLLTDCTARAPMADDLVHPIVLFHAPILGAGTSIGELFRLGRASGRSGSVGLLGYDWVYHRPLREEIDLTVTGGVISADRRTDPDGRVDDLVAYRIELADADGPVAQITNRWAFRRGGPRGAAKTVPDAPFPPEGRTIEPFDVPSVDAARMKTMAAILRDPYPVHWDRASNERLGLGGRVINQGPLNLGYVANMLMAWAGDAAVRRLTVSFGPPVLDGDHVTARGVVTGVVDGIAHCDVWLERDGAPVVRGTAEVVAPAG
jgi:acyl dehydratase